MPCKAVTGATGQQKSSSMPACGIEVRKMIAKILLFTVVLAILGTAPAVAASAVGSDLGKDLSGESCHLQSKDIVCGTEENPVGLLWSADKALSLPSDAAGREASLLAAAQSVP